MYKLTIDFKNKQELIAFLMENPEAPATIDFSKEAAELPPVIEKKPAAKKAKKEEVAVEVTPSPAQPMVEQPAVKNEPAVQPAISIAAAPVDRAALIAKATQLVAALKATGIADAEVMPKIHEVYNQAGCPLNLKIGQFSDENLADFLPLFEQKVASLVKANKAPEQAGSFI